MTDSSRLRGRNAKILATIGPKSASPGDIRLLAEAGADLFRLNFSHGDHESHEAVFAAIRATEAEMGRPLTILADLQGPKIRVGTFPGGELALERGKSYAVIADEGTQAPDTIPVPHPEILSALEEGDDILCDDGMVRLTVSETGDRVYVTPAFDAVLSDRKGFTVRDKTLPLKAMTEKDHEDLAFALKLGVDFVALSFVQSVDDVREARSAIDGRAPLIAKVEKPGAVADLDAVIRAADGVMIARGDLGVEFPLEQVPIIQRRIVREAREVGRPVIVATQMLESMIENASPTRAETGDVATAVYQGVDAVMLSAETAIGHHPPTAVAVMDRIIKATEAAPDYRDSLKQFMGERDEERVIDIVARAAQSLAFAVKARALALRTGSARRLAQFAKHRGRYFILYGSSDDRRLRRAQLFWGVHPIHVAHIEQGDWPRTLMDAAGLEGAVAYAAWKGGGDDTAWEMGIRR